MTPQWVSHELYPFDNHYVEIDCCRVHYVDEGTGPPLLLLHGNPAWSFLYRNTIAVLHDQFRCVAVDYPGFGLSTASEDVLRASAVIVVIAAQEHPFAGRFAVSPTPLEQVDPAVSH